MPDAVTGAFSFTGRAIATQLLGEGREVVTLVRHPAPADADPRIRTAPIAFDDPTALTAALRGVDTLYSTYWIRFARSASFSASSLAHALPRKTRAVSSVNP